MSARIMDMSTRKLKRYYIGALKSGWYFQNANSTMYPTGYVDAQECAQQAKEELHRRGVWVP
jgi:hypothetical protein